MKAIQISRTGGTDVLEPVELPTPSPGPGEVLVKATVNGELPETGLPVNWATGGGVPTVM